MGDRVFLPELLKIKEEDLRKFLREYRRKMGKNLKRYYIVAGGAVKKEESSSPKNHRVLIYPLKPVIDALENRNKRKVVGIEPVAEFKVWMFPLTAYFHGPENSLYVGCDGGPLIHFIKNGKVKLLNPLTKLPNGIYTQIFGDGKDPYLYALTTGIGIDSIIRIRNTEVIGGSVILPMAKGHQFSVWITRSPEGRAYLHYLTKEGDEHYYHISRIRISDGRLYPEDKIYSDRCKDNIYFRRDNSSPRFDIGCIFAKSEIYGRYLITTGDGETLKAVNLETGKEKILSHRSGRFLILPKNNDGYIIISGGGLNTDKEPEVLEVDQDFQPVKRLTLKYSFKEDFNRNFWIYPLTALKSYY